jgi:radical SAM superfamily enzyme YgiQ (UPF0313 family)
LSLIYLGGYLKYHGMRVKIIDVTMQNIVRDKAFFRDREKLLGAVRNEQLRQLDSTDSAVYGISCYSPEFEEVKELALLIRYLRPHAKIVVGGVHPTLKPEDFKDIADVTVQGEGEHCLYHIVANSWGKTIHCDPMPINEISHPDYTLVDMDYYTQPNPYAIRGIYIRPAYVLASRGCPSQCAFCVAPQLARYTTTGRYRSPARIGEEIYLLKKQYKVDGIYFVDDMLTHNQEFIYELCKQIRVWKVIWGCSSKINTVNKDMLKEMAKSGCVQIDFGVERGSDQALHDIRKYQSIKQIKTVFKQCKEVGIRTFANMLINIPGETPKDYEDILDLLDEIKPSVTSINIYQEYLGTRLKGKEPIQWQIAWAELITKRYTSLMEAIHFHTSLRYIRILLWSHGKISYLKNLLNLIREFLNLRK